MKNTKCLLLSTVLLLLGGTVWAQFTEKDKEMFKNGQVMKPEQIRYAPSSEKYDPSSLRIYSIEHRGKETVVTFIQPIYFDSQWVSFGYGFRLVDRKSGDIYMVRNYEEPFSMDNLLIVKGCNRKNILISLVFPKLKRRVKAIDILDVPHEKDLIPSNDDGVRRCFYHVKVEDYLPLSQKKVKVYY